MAAKTLPSTDGFTAPGDYAKTFGTTLVIGSNRGLGLSITQSLMKNGVTVHATIRGAKETAPEALASLNCKQIIGGIDLLDHDAPDKLVTALNGTKLDTVLVVAGYFTQETFTELNRAEELKMFEICSIAPVFILSALFKAGLLPSGARVGFITSEGGSIGLRTEQEGGANYGHHMSKCAANMAGKLLAWDMKPHGIALVSIHPGFLRTEMTADKYAHLYDELGAITADAAVPYILQPVADLKLETTGRFVAALGSYALGLGVWALDDPSKCVPGSDLPW